MFALSPLSGHAETRTINVDGLYAAVKSNPDDGKLSREELKKYPKLAAIVSQQLHKGYVTKAEVEAMYSAHSARNISVFHALDRNHDGKVSYQEVVAGALPLAKAFAYLDQGTKGYLTLNDFFSPRFVIQFTSAGSQGKSTSQDVANLDVRGATSLTSETSSVARLQLDDGVFSLDESPTLNDAELVQLPDGVLTWDQWMENSSYTYARAKVCPPDTPPGVQCIERIVVVGQRDPEPVADIVNPWEVVVLLPFDDVSMGRKPTPESIVELIRKSSCVKSGEDCDVFATRVLNECYGALGLIVGRDLCRNLSADLLIGCSTGQVSACQI